MTFKECMVKPSNKSFLLVVYFESDPKKMTTITHQKIVAMITAGTEAIISFTKNI